MERAFKMKELLQSKKLILVCGSGGVGKTTTAAVLGIVGAVLGKKTIVVTVDPAKRLATSLGIPAFLGTPQKIDPKLIEKVSGQKGAVLDALQIDSKNMFDHLVMRYAKNQTTANAILKNPIYQKLSQMMAGSEDYMAMEKLYELTELKNYDLIIVDTPPTSQAIDFLEAPQKMISALQGSMIEILLKPALLLGSQGLGLFERSSRFLLKALDRFAGIEFLKDIAELLGSFKDMLKGFEERSTTIDSLLKNKETSFILVTTCEEKSVTEMSRFTQLLSEKNYTLGGLLVNRVYPFIEPTLTKEENKSLTEFYGKNLTEKMEQMVQRFYLLACRDKKITQSLEAEIQKNQKNALVKTIPFFDSDIHHIDGLWKIAEIL